MVALLLLNEVSGYKKYSEEQAQKVHDDTIRDSEKIVSDAIDKTDTQDKEPPIKDFRS